MMDIPSIIKLVNDLEHDQLGKDLVLIIGGFLTDGGWTTYQHALETFLKLRQDMLKCELMRVNLQLYASRYRPFMDFEQLLVRFATPEVLQRLADIEKRQEKLKMEGHEVDLYDYEHLSIEI